MRKRWLTWIGCVFLVAASAHAESAAEIAYRRINGDYRATARQVFAERCFACHNSHEPIPGPFRVGGSLNPLADQVKSDIASGRRQLELAEDFPFTSPANPSLTPVAILESIQSSVSTGAMPPLYYRIDPLNFESRDWSWQHPLPGDLSDSERTTLLKWVERSIAELNRASAQEPGPTQTIKGWPKVSQLLTQHCLICHGSAHPAGGLRIDPNSPESLASQIKAGAPEDSPLVHHLESPVTDSTHMPPGLSLPATDIAIVKDWISTEGSR